MLVSSYFSLLPITSYFKKFWIPDPRILEPATLPRTRLLVLINFYSVLPSALMRLGLAAVCV